MLLTHVYLSVRVLRDGFSIGLGDLMGPGFGRLWTASAAGNLGDGVGRVAIALLAVRLTRDPFAISVIAALSFLPWLVLGLPAGALVDRYDRRRLAFAVGLVRAAAVAVLFTAVAVDTVSLWLLYTVVLVLGVCETMYDNAIVAMVPMVVTDRERLEAANGRLQAAEMVAQSFVALPLGSLIFAAAAAAAFGINAALFTVAALLLTALPGRYVARRPDGPPGGPPASLRGEMSHAVRYVWTHPLHRTMLVFLVAIGFGNAMGSAMVALWAREVLGIGEAAFGPFLVVATIGALAGSQTAAPLAARLGRGRTLITSVVVTGMAFLGAGATTSPYLAAAAFAVSGWAIVTWNVVAGALRQRLTPEGLLGRTVGIYRVATWGVMPLGALAGGMIAAAGGLRAPFLVAGGLTVLAGLLAATRLTNQRVDTALADADAEEEQHAA